MNHLLLGLAATAVASTLVAGTWLPQPDDSPPGPELLTSGGTRASDPVRPFVVERGFEAPEPYGPGHRGVDLAAWPGQVVRSALPGSVQSIGRVAGRPIVVIAHGGDVRTTYLPVLPAVSEGDVVDGAEPIGRLATEPHCPAGPCLHWGARRYDTYFDPLSLLPGKVVLLPPPTGGHLATATSRAADDGLASLRGQLQ